MGETGCEKPTLLTKVEDKALRLRDKLEKIDSSLRQLKDELFGSVPSDKTEPTKSPVPGGRIHILDDFLSDCESSANNILNYVGEIKSKI